MLGHLREAGKCRISMPYMNNFLLNKYCQQHTGQPVPGKSRPAQAIPPRISLTPVHKYIPYHLDIQIYPNINRIIRIGIWKNKQMSLGGNTVTSQVSVPITRPVFHGMCRYHGSRSAPTLHGLVTYIPRLICIIVYIKQTSYVYHWYCIQHC